MKSKLLLSTLALGVIGWIAACNSGSDKGAASTDATANAPAASSSSTDTSASTNPKGVGKFADVKLTHPLDQAMIASGKAVYDLKCSSCHKLTNEKLVGPGWKGVTDRRQPEWIMNFVTNTAVMLQKDTAAKNLYEVCLVQMPNQNLSDRDARSILEFQRNNDGKK